MTETRTNVKGFPEVRHALRSIVFRLSSLEGDLLTSVEKEGLLILIAAAAAATETDFGIRSVLSVSTDTLLKKTDNLVFVDASSGNVVISLAAAASRKGKQYDIKKMDSSEHTVAIDGHENELVEGEPRIFLTEKGECVTVASDNSNWNII